MVVQETAAGTPVVDLSPEEYDAYLENEVKRSLGMTVAEFRSAYQAGQLEESDPAVSELVMLLRVGQNGRP
jgi:hypothetical protein